MKMPKRWLWIIVPGISTLSVCICYGFLATSVLLRLTAVAFPLEESWSQSLGHAVVDISASSDDSEILVRTNKVLYAIQPAKGTILWSLPLSKQVDHSPARSTAKMVFVSDSESLQALDINDGRVIWKQPLPQSGGRLVDLSEAFVLVNQTGYDIRAYDTQSGRFLWSLPVGRGFVQAYINEDIVYVADHGITAVGAITGKPIWQEGNEVIGTSIHGGGVIYYASGNKISAFSIQTRTELWNVNMPDNGFQRLKLEKGFLFVMDESNLYEFDTSDGRIVWNAEISHPTNPVIIGDNIYILEGFSRIIRAFNFTTKKEIGHVRVSAPHLLVVDKQDMFSAADILLFSTGPRIFAFK